MEFHPRYQTGAEKKPDTCCVNIAAKKRYINALVLTETEAARISDVDPDICRQIEDFLSLDFDKWLYAE